MKTSTAQIVICREPGCGKSFEGKYAHQAEATHYHRVHSRRVVVPNKRYRLRSKRRKAKAKLAVARFSTRNGHTRLKTAGLINKDGTLDGRSKEARALKPRKHAHQEEIQFCPNCLTDLMAAARALVKSGQTHLHVNGCPKCGCNIKAVAQELVTTRV
jgi:hypothetical protein